MPLNAAQSPNRTSHQNILLSLRHTHIAVTSPAPAIHGLTVFHSGFHLHQKSPALRALHPVLITSFLNHNLKIKKKTATLAASLSIDISLLQNKYT